MTAFKTKKNKPQNIKISNDKIQQVKEYRSPKTYMKECIYEQPPIQKERKKKVSTDNFKILDYTNYRELTEKNYNVSQLKSICRFYKLKKSGNKKELIFRVYNFLKFSNFTLKIQKVFRGHLIRYLDKLKGTRMINNCVNETDFYTLDKLTDLNKSQFYSFKDEDGFIYGFDICSLYNMIVKERQKKNPYNRKELPIQKIYNDIKQIIKISKLYGVKINIEFDNDLSNFSQEKQLEMRAINLFQQIDGYGFITDSKWYLNLDRNCLKRFIRELLDIWQYRAQISNETKRKINPQHGDPFFTVNMNVLLHKCYEVMRKRVLDIIEIFITKGIDTDARALGTYYILGALTTVNHDAATSLPWLYESFVQNQT
tara:strand:+ start:528 stop:1637 length:1110 start_codon:yes stop_codon:yes gene_type:complete